MTSLRALEELEASIARFSSEVLEGIEATEHEIQRKAEVLDQIVADRRRALAGWQATYDEADDEEDDVGFIQRKLEEAEEGFREARQWQRKVEELCGGYDKCAKQTAFLGDGHSDKARGFLRARITELCDYLALKPGPAGGATSGAQPREPGILDAVLSAAEATVDSVVSAGEAGAFAMTGLPLPKGFGWVRLEDLRPDEMAELPPQNDYRKNDLSESDMRAGLELLRTRILPVIQKDPATANREHFAELDATESRSGSESLANIFSAYFGPSDHIWVDRFKGDKFFGIGNGRHRIKAARDLGWTAVPARIDEVDRH
ncbi:MAG: hypothetical protein JWM21_266 [Acidobacteria bacterium]|nr:hypothetical protein [Acidobacteriota bacterium]